MRYKTIYFDRYYKCYRICVIHDGLNFVSQISYGSRWIKNTIIYDILENCLFNQRIESHKIIKRLK